MDLVEGQDALPLRSKRRATSLKVCSRQSLAMHDEIAAEDPTPVAARSTSASEIYGSSEGAGFTGPSHTASR